MTSRAAQALGRAAVAWEGGGLPARPEFCHQVPPALARAILDRLAREFPPAGRPEARLNALQPVESPAGGFRLEVNQDQWFGRINARPGMPALEKAVSDHLAARNAPVNPMLLPGMFLDWNQARWRMDLRPLVKGRHWNGSVEDALNAAESLGLVHRALKDFPGTDLVRSSAAERFARLDGINREMGLALSAGDFGFFAERSGWARQNATWLGRMADQFHPGFHRLPGAQCLHGDMHPANVLFLEPGGKAVLVDLEETVHVFAPPAWDLAMLLQRWRLADDPPPDEARERADDLLAAYGEPCQGLAEMMRQLAWLAIASILDLRRTRGLVTAEAEWSKFIGLERQARRLLGVL